MSITVTLLLVVAVLAFAGAAAVSGIRALRRVVRSFWPHS
jgi:hypothetical protein